MKNRLLFWLLCLLPFTAPAQQADQTTFVLSTQSTLPYRYVNASSLTLRAQPSATSSALAKLAGASRVQVRDVRTDGWSEVQAQNYTGYVKSSYLVDDQQEVTAETVDWELVQAFGGTEYTNVTAVPVSAPVVTPATRIRKATPKVAAGPKVYICGNGRTEVYHSSEGCSAMRRCTYQTLVMNESQARNSGLRGCMKCYQQRFSEVE